MKEPSPVVKWLGIWFDNRLTFKQHVTIRVGQAKAAFYRMARLTNSEKGLSPIAMRQLYLASVTSVCDYASQVWWKGQKNFLVFLQNLQNLALRKILGCFRTTPIRPMEVEACLCPPDTRLNHCRRKYALRNYQLGPSHPVAYLLKEYLASSDLGNDTTYQGKQLNLINQSVDIEADLENVEPIVNYGSPPWKGNLPYDIYIGRQPKGEEALIHLGKIRESLGSSTILYYTDASYYTESSRIGIAFKAFDQLSSETWMEYNNIGIKNLIFNGELEAITSALEHANRIDKLRNQITIYSNSQAVLLRLSSLKDKPGKFCATRARIAAKKLKEKGVKVTLEWVPGHSDISENIEVDQIAKDTSLEPPDINYSTSLAYVSQS